jgi:hypothetical protein
MRASIRDDDVAEPLAPQIKIDKDPSNKLLVSWILLSPQCHRTNLFLSYGLSTLLYEDMLS